MAGKTLDGARFYEGDHPAALLREGSRLPVHQFPGIDIALGPEMKSTGEVMGIDADLGLAYAKAQMAAQPPLPQGGNIFISVKDSDKDAVAALAAGFRRARLQDLRHRRHRQRPSRQNGVAGEQASSSSPKAARTCST